MTTRNILIGSLLLVTLYALSQPNHAVTLAALHKALSKEKSDDSHTVAKLLDIGVWHLEASMQKRFPHSHDSVSYYAGRAQRLAEKLGDYKGYGRSQLLYGRLALGDRDYRKAQDYAGEALLLFRKNRDEAGEAEALMLGATSYSEKAELSQITAGRKALDIYRKTGDKLKQADALRLIGAMYASRSDYGHGLSCQKQGLEVLSAGKLRNKELVLALLEASGACYMTGSIEEAFNYSFEALKLAGKLDPSADYTARAFNSLGRLYFTTGEYAKALDHHKKAISILQNYPADDALTNAISSTAQVLADMGVREQSLAYLKKLQQRIDISPGSRASVIFRCIKIYCEFKDYHSAGKFVKQAIELIDESPLAMSSSNLYGPVANYYLKTGQYGLARNYLEKYKEIAKANASKIIYLQIYKQLYQVDSAQGALIPAIKNLKLAYIYRDSMFGEKNRQQIADLQVKYDVLRKDRDLLAKEKKNQELLHRAGLQDVRLAKSNMTRNMSIAGAIILSLTTGLFYSRYRNKQKINTILQDQKAAISTSNEALTRLVAEKEWLLKEIHHRVKNNLHIVMSLLNGQSYFLKDKAALTAIQNSQHRIQSMSLIHQKLYMSDNLTAIRMPEYVNELVDYLKESFAISRAIKFTINVDNVAMDVSQAVPVGLILNEALTNCFKYAFPDQKGSITIILKHIGDEAFLLEISDTGCGMPEGFSAEHANSLGMKLIRGLAEDLGGTLAVTTGAGTRVRVEFRYKQLIFTPNS